MEYLYYLSIVVAILAALIWSMRRPSEHDLMGRSVKNETLEKEHEAAEREYQSARQLSQVPVPWGWPGSDQELRHHEPVKPNDVGVPNSLYRWADQLVSQKKTIADDGYQKRKQDSFRALLEDRYVSPSQMIQIDYRKKRAPLLGDTSGPHDQMDNFPSRRQSTVESNLSERPRVDDVTTNPVLASEQLSSVKTPWGW